MLFDGGTVVEKENLVLKLPRSNRIDFKKAAVQVKIKYQKAQLFCQIKVMWCGFDSWII